MQEGDVYKERDRMKVSLQHIKNDFDAVGSDSRNWLFPVQFIAVQCSPVQSKVVKPCHSYIPIEGMAEAESAA